MQKTICPKCKSLRYSTSREAKWRCRACGATVNIEPPKPKEPELLRYKQLRERLVDLGVYDL